MRKTENRSGEVTARGPRRDTAELGFEPKQAGAQRTHAVRAWEAGTALPTGSGLRAVRSVPLGSWLGPVSAPRLLGC